MNSCSTIAEIAACIFNILIIANEMGTGPMSTSILTKLIWSICGLQSNENTQGRMIFKQQILEAYTLAEGLLYRI